MVSDDASGCMDDAQRLMDRVESALSRSQAPVIDNPVMETPASTTTPAG
ncbi:hypothetical protein [Stieleria mannarensis]|nr:hypothetical protein [Rhodopirellula sp. JC639]